MFNEHDEKAREIVSEFCKRYNVSHKFTYDGILPDPKVWLMIEIARALKDTADK